VTTASRALSNADHPIAEETRQAVLDAARELGYRPNLVARSLRTDRTLTIGIVVENLLSPFNPLIMQGIQDVLDKHNYLSITINSYWDHDTEIAAIQTFRARQIDGILLVESCIRSSDEVFRLAGVPHVFVHRLFDSLASGSVVPDDRQGGRLAVHHLIGLGHRRIGFINGPEGWDASANRLRGYRDELTAAAIPFDDQLVLVGDWEVRSGYDAARTLISCDTRPTAVFAANDLMALGAIYAAQEAGLDVPGDLAVVGYDDRDMAGFVRPGITTVQMPCQEMGRRSAQLLVELIDGHGDRPAPILIPGKLVVRQSCGGSNEPWDFEPERASFTRVRRRSCPDSGQA